jgi:AraC-like DNA-binding protein
LSQHKAVQHPTNLEGLEARSCLSDRTFPRHAHDQVGLGVMEAGAHRTWSGMGHVEPEAGDVIATNPGEMHDGAPFDRRPRAWRMLYLDPARAQALLSEEVEPVPVVRPAIRDPGLAALVRRAFARATAPNGEAMATEEDLLRGLVWAMSGPGRPSRLAAFVGRALQRMHDAPEAPTSLAELAGLAGVSRFQLIRAFARQVGVTPHRYLVQLRVEQARRRLSLGETLSAAAAGSGFADQSHMTRAFVRQFGVTPGKYRLAVL